MTSFFSGHFELSFYSIFIDQSNGFYNSKVRKGGKVLLSMSMNKNITQSFFLFQAPNTPTMISLFCLYGYSLSIYIPVALLWTIQVQWLQWLFVLMAAFVSGAVLIFWLLPALRKSKYFLILIGSILAFHFLLAAGFMLYFFHAPSVVPVIAASTRAPTTVVV